jgi:TonB family protein
MYLGKKHKVFAMLRTIIVFAIIMLILLWVHFKTPIPPYPEGGGGPGMGLEVNLGSSDFGTSDNQQSEPINMPDFSSASPDKQEPEKVLTSDVEENEIKESPVKKDVEKTVLKKNHHKKIETDKKEKNSINDEKIEKHEINTKALFHKSSNEGTTQKAGDQGSPGGTVGSPLYKGNGKGSGGGTGGGSGLGTGTGQGIGVSSNLGDRVSYLKPPEYNSQNEGKVVVEITVNSEGRVTDASPGAKGSTTLDDYLLQVAKNAALQSKFTRKSDATVQKGTITYRFLLQ